MMEQVLAKLDQNGALSNLKDQDSDLREHNKKLKDRMVEMEMQNKMQGNAGYTPSHSSPMSSSLSPRRRCERRVGRE